MALTETPAERGEAFLHFQPFQQSKWCWKPISYLTPVKGMSSEQMIYCFKRGKVYLRGAGHKGLQAAWCGQAVRASMGNRSSPLWYDWWRHLGSSRCQIPTRWSLCEENCGLFFEPICKPRASLNSCVIKCCCWSESSCQRRHLSLSKQTSAAWESVQECSTAQDWMGLWVCIHTTGCSTGVFLWILQTQDHVGGINSPLAEFSDNNNK